MAIWLRVHPDHAQHLETRQLLLDQPPLPTLAQAHTRTHKHTQAPRTSTHRSRMATSAASNFQLQLQLQTQRNHVSCSNSSVKTFESVVSKTTEISKAAVKPIACAKRRASNVGTVMSQGVEEAPSSFLCTLSCPSLT